MTRHIRKLVLAAAIAASLSFAVVSCSGDDSASPVTDAGSDAHPDVIRDAAPDRVKPDVVEAGPSFNQQPASEGPIVYWGGPVILGSPNVYFIWYGEWGGSNTPAILEDLIKGFGETSYSRILTAYYQVPQRVALDGGPDAADADASDDADSTVSDADAEIADAGIPDGPYEHISGRVNFARSIYVGYPRGNRLIPGAVQGIVTDLLRAGDLPYDPSAIYYVMTSSDVAEGDFRSQFCADYCGWHNGHVIDGVTIQYAMVGDPAACLEGCSLSTQFQEAGIPKSPNDNWSADSMASVVIHELSEAMTDPQPYDAPAWLDSYQESENGDMCAWRFDPTYPTLNGSRANTRFGGRDFLIQQMWVIDADGGHCDLEP